MGWTSGATMGPVGHLRATVRRSLRIIALKRVLIDAAMACVRLIQMLVYKQAMDVRAHYLIAARRMESVCQVQISVCRRFR